MLRYVPMDAVVAEQVAFLNEVARQKYKLRALSEDDLWDLAEALVVARRVFPSTIFLSRNLFLTADLGVYSFEGEDAVSEINLAVLRLLSRVEKVEDVLAYHLENCAWQLVSFWKESEKKDVFLSVSDGSAFLTENFSPPSILICPSAFCPAGLQGQELLKQAALVMMVSLRDYLKWTFFSWVF